LHVVVQVLLAQEDAASYLVVAQSHTSKKVQVVHVKVLEEHLTTLVVVPYMVLSHVAMLIALTRSSVEPLFVVL
jgi:hypothetical protein